MYIPQLIHPVNGYGHFTLNGHWVHLQFKTIIKILLRTFCTCLRIYKCIYFSRDIPRSGIAISWVMCSSNLIRKWKLDSKVIILISAPTTSTWELSFLHIPANTCFYQIFYFAILGVCDISFLLDLAGTSWSLVDLNIFAYSY